MKNLWYAEFTYAFQSGSGMERSMTTKEDTAYVATQDGGLRDVEKVIADQLGLAHPSHVKLDRATFIGEVWGV